MSIFSALAASQYRAAARSAAEAKGKARSVGTDLEDVEQRLDRALMACEAMWTLMRDKLGMTDVELIERINDIDLSDGRLDGKVRKTPVSCPKCHRTISRKMPQCLYCGQIVMHDPFA